MISKKSEKELVEMEIGWWQKPKLTSEGQTVFWDRQAPTYEIADMTNDNPQEIEYVVEQFQQNKYDEIVTLGGAVGCRDPHMILQRAYCVSSSKGCLLGNKMPAKIFFNDLASRQVKYAQDKILARCAQSCALDIEFHAGHAIEACETVGRNKKQGRVLFLGVYKLEGFFKAVPQENYPEAGFVGYIKNQETLGDCFWYDLLYREKDRLHICPLNIRLPLTEQPELKEQIFRHLYSQLWQKQSAQSFVALQIVGAHKNLPGFFLSHWYKLGPLTNLLEIVFDPREFSIIHQEFPKGYVFQIQRRATEPKGAITILNNVLGNILPDEQLSTLFAIRTLM